MVVVVVVVMACPLPTVIVELLFTVEEGRPVCEMPLKVELGIGDSGGGVLSRILLLPDAKVLKELPKVIVPIVPEMDIVVLDGTGKGGKLELMIVEGVDKGDVACVVADNANVDSNDSEIVLSIVEMVGRLVSLRVAVDVSVMLAENGGLLVDIDEGVKRPDRDAEIVPLVLFDVGITSEILETEILIPIPLPIL